MDNFDKKNAEGYSDPTPYQAVKNMIKPGEIWTFQKKDNTEVEVLVVAFNDNVATILFLMDDYKDGCVECVSKSLKYVNPRMLNWTWGGYLNRCIRKMSVQEFNQIGLELEKVLSVKVGKEAESMASKSFTSLLQAEKEVEKMKIQVELLKSMYNDLMEKFLQRV